MAFVSLTFYLLVFILALLSVILIFTMILLHKQEKFYYETFSAVAKITKKEATSCYVRVGFINKKDLLVFDYLLYCVYDGNFFYIKSRELYDSYNEGDLINVLVHKGHNKLGQEKIFFTGDFKTGRYN